MESKPSPNLDSQCPSTEVTVLLSFMFCMQSKNLWNISHLLRYFMLQVIENSSCTGFNFKKNVGITDFQNCIVQSQPWLQVFSFLHLSAVPSSSGPFPSQQQHGRSCFWPQNFNSPYFATIFWSILYKSWYFLCLTGLNWVTPSSLIGLSLSVNSEDQVILPKYVITNVSEFRKGKSNECSPQSNHG